MKKNAVFAPLSRRGVLFSAWLAARIFAAALAGMTVLPGAVQAQISLHEMRRIVKEGGNPEALPLLPLVETVANHGSVVARGRLYLIGGERAAEPGAEPQPSSRVISAKIELGGGLGPWREEAPLPAAPLGPLTSSCATLGDSAILAALGGNGGGGGGRNGASNRIAVARLDEAGRIRAWTLSPPWPGPPAIETALAVADCGVFVVGGFDPVASATLANVYRAPRNVFDGAADSPQSGDSSLWNAEAPLPAPRRRAAALAAGKRLFVISGYERAAQGPPLPKVFSLALGTTSTLGLNWSRAEAPLARPVSGGACALLGNARLCWFGTFQKAGLKARGFQTAVPAESGIRSWRSSSIDLPEVDGFGFAADPVARRAYITGGRQPESAGGRTIPDVWVVALGSEDETAKPGVASAQQSSAAREGDVIFSTPVPAAIPTLPPNLEPYMPEPPVTFYSEGKAFEEAHRRGVPMLLVVYSGADAESQRLRSGLFAQQKFLNSMDGIVLGEVNVDERPEARTEYGAESLPCFLLYNAKGTLIERNTAARSLGDFAKLTFKVR